MGKQNKDAKRAMPERLQHNKELKEVQERKLSEKEKNETHNTGGRKAIWVMGLKEEGEQ
jgi:hypothetical protein